MVSGSRIVVVVGRGAREHALAWRLARDPGVSRVLLAPGNAATARTFAALDVREDDVPGLVAACRAAGATLVVVGPEAPLAAGLIDALTAADIPAYGPTAAAARLETSKWFAKEMLRAAGAPTPRAERHVDLTGALAALDRFGAPWVVKADGLAAGKGVWVGTDRAEAEAFVRACLAGARFGEAGRAVVIEEFLAGEEASVMAVCDGTRAVLLPAARDHKRAYDGDRGPNTGGMGAVAPAPRVDAALESVLMARVFTPVLAVMAARGTPFRGTLYAGLMLGADGASVLEFNVRFGDPETQVVLPLVDGDFAGLLAGAAAGRVDAGAVQRRAGAAVGIALVDEGYPDHVRGGGRITGLDAVEQAPGQFVFHAGTAPTPDGWQVHGGRAVTVVACADSAGTARASAYSAIASLGGEGWRFRTDVAGPGAMPAPREVRA
jgi:phosphoribosylamine--glycine ligase